MSNLEVAAIVYAIPSVMAGWMYALDGQRYDDSLLNFFIDFFVGFALWPVKLSVQIARRIRK